MDELNSLLSSIGSYGQNSLPHSPQINGTNAPGQESGGSFLDSLLGFNTSDLSSSLLGGKNQTGMLELGTNLYTGLKQLGLMEDQLDLQEDSFKTQKAFQETNLSNQATGLNAFNFDRASAKADFQGLAGGERDAFIQDSTDRSKLKTAV